jgi:hypothetical protein
MIAEPIEVGDRAEGRDASGAASELSGWGRFVYPGRSAVARRYLEWALVSLRGRRARLEAIFWRHRIRRTIPAVEFPDVTVALAAEVANLSPNEINDWLLVSDYSDGPRERRIVFFLEPSGQPRLVVKLRPLASGGESLAREHEILQRLYDVVSGALRQTLPESLDYSVRAGHEVLVLRGLPGRSLSIQMQRALRPRRAHLEQLINAGRWLGSFHQMTQDEKGVAVHGDLWPRNILFDEDGRLSGVVDWENGASTGEPWADLFTLPLLFVVDAPAWRTVDPLEQFRDGFIRRTGLARGVSAYFRAYGERTGVGFESMREQFQRFLTSSGEADKSAAGGQTRFRCSEMAAELRRSSHTVFD